MDPAQSGAEKPSSSQASADRNTTIPPVQCSERLGCHKLQGQTEAKWKYRKRMSGLTPPSIPSTAGTIKCCFPWEDWGSSISCPFNTTLYCKQYLGATIAPNAQLEKKTHIGAWICVMGGPVHHTSVFATTLCLKSFRKNIGGRTKEDNSSLSHNQIYIHTLSATHYGKGCILLLASISSLLRINVCAKSVWLLPGKRQACFRITETLPSLITAHFSSPGKTVIINIDWSLHLVLVLLLNHKKHFIR